MNRKIFLFIFVAVFLLIFYTPLRELLFYSTHPKNTRYNSHIVFIPIICGYLMYLKRKEIAENAKYSIGKGIAVIMVGICLYFVTLTFKDGLYSIDNLSLKILATIITMWGGFVLLLGPGSFRTALFPLLFLIFLIPIPARLMEYAFRFLQMCSTEVSYGFFELTGIPIARDGFIFHLPGLSIEVAEQCSGMRSTISLVIVGILSGHLFLRTLWKKMVLAVVTLPITILGNGLRIGVLTLLSIYVNSDFIVADSLLHLKGGWVFFLFDFALLGGIMVILRKTEKACFEIGNN